MSSCSRFAQGGVDIFVVNSFGSGFQVGNTLGVVVYRVFEDVVVMASISPSFRSLCLPVDLLLQALFVLLLLPFLSNLRGIPFHQLPACMKEAAGCFLNVSSLAKGVYSSQCIPGR